MVAFKLNIKSDTNEISVLTIDNIEALASGESGVFIETCMGIWGIVKLQQEQLLKLHLFVCNTRIFTHKNESLDQFAICELIRESPERALLAIILTGKYADHLPSFRQKHIFAREGIQIPSSTIEGWTRQALEKLEPLYNQLLFDTNPKGTCRLMKRR